MPRANFTDAQKLVDNGDCFDVVEALALLTYEEEMDAKAAIAEVDEELTTGRVFGEWYEQLCLDDRRA